MWGDLLKNIEIEVDEALFLEIVFLDDAHQCQIHVDLTKEYDLTSSQRDHRRWVLVKANGSLLFLWMRMITFVVAIYRGNVNGDVDHVATKFISCLWSGKHLLIKIIVEELVKIKKQKWLFGSRNTFWAIILNIISFVGL